MCVCSIILSYIHRYIYTLYYVYIYYMCVYSIYGYLTWLTTLSYSQKKLRPTQLRRPPRSSLRAWAVKSTADR